MNRYYLPPTHWGENQLSLTGEEAHHATRVMRVKVDEVIEIFDGNGKSAVCTVLDADRRTVSCAVEQTTDHEAPAHPITLCQSIPKGSNMELIIQKSVEIGVNAIQPLITERTVARPDAMKKKQEKWQRVALEACKQCGQNYLPEVKEPVHFQPWITSLQAFDTPLIASLDEHSLHLKEHLQTTPLKGNIGLLIGPEGDFSPEEYQLAYGAGFQPISFGYIVMRVETAAIFGLSVIQHERSFV